MSILNHSPTIVRDGLVFCLDIGAVSSHPGSGTVVRNLVDRNHTGTIGGATYTVSDGARSSKGMRYLAFDGTNDSLSLLNVENWMPTGDYTVEIVFDRQFTAADSSQYVLRYASGAYMFFRGDGNNDTFFCLRKIGANAVSGASSSDWYGNSSWGGQTGVKLSDGANEIGVNDLRHITFTMESHRTTGVGKAYRDGVYMQSANLYNNNNGASTDDHGGFVAESGSIVIAHNYSEMSLYVLRFYNRILTAKEIESNYRATKARFGK